LLIIFTLIALFIDAALAPVFRCFQADIFDFRRFRFAAMPLRLIFAMIRRFAFSLS